MYQLAGADLEADLSMLTAHAGIAPGQGGLEWMMHTSIPTGDLQVEAMDQRLQTGHGGSVAETSVLQRGAEAKGLDGANYVEFCPGKFINNRGWTPAP